MLELFAWLGLIFLAGGGALMQMVAASVRDLSTVMRRDDARVRRIEWIGGGLSVGASASAAALAVLVLVNVRGEVWLGAVGAGCSVAIALAAQTLARAYARRRLEQLAAPLLGDAISFLPLMGTHEETAAPEIREETIVQMVDASEKVGLIESDEREMIAGILQLDNTLTREIMVPRMDVIALDADVPLCDALDVVIAGAHARVPVYEENIDHVCGLLYAKDLLKLAREGSLDVPLRSLLRPAHFVPESKPVDELLQELQRDKVHMAIVVDEYGGTAGIVTIEDVLEEIVGEIQDEYDTGEEPLFERVSETEIVFNARVNLDQVNETLGLDLPGDSDTLGGWMYQHLEKLPKAGDQIRWGETTFSVLTMLGRRIKQVRATQNVNADV